MDYSVYQQPPQDFAATVQAAGCYIACKERLLLLKRAPSRPQGNTWGVPAGKLELGESPHDCVIREIQEEVGLDISRDVQPVGKLYIRLENLDYVYHMYYKAYCDFPQLSLALDENVEARWVTLSDALELPLITGGKEALVHFRDSFIETGECLG